MAITGKLSPRFVKSAPVGRHGDGGGLWLTVRPDQSKYWTLRFTFRGKKREMGLGAVELIGLAAARDSALDARRLARDGIDPIAERKKRERREVPTFSECAEKYIAANEVGWKNKKHRYQWRATIEDFVNKYFGAKPVDLVERSDVLKALEEIWTDKPETASRVRGRIEKILDWARVHGYRSGDNPAKWRGNLEAVLPAKSKIQKVTHLKALPYAEVGAFINDLRKREGTAARALEFSILTASRPGEIRGATWGEIDLDAGVWTVPDSRGPAGNPHKQGISQRIRLRFCSILEGLTRIAENIS